MMTCKYKNNLTNLYKLYNYISMYTKYYYTYLCKSNIKYF